ncbi:MAG: c-type cytochrome [Janthinobacterium lividum]
MKKVFLLLSAGVLLAACDSGYKPDGPDQANAEKAAQQPEAALNPDSITATNVAASDHQLQVDTATTKIGTSPTGVPDGGKGAKLMASSDCASCHREREKLLGPAYVAIAEKYPSTPANIAMLGKKIISGGKGNWGDIAMTPHPGLSESDAKEMVKYILTLK